MDEIRTMVACLPPKRRVVRYKKDQVGNDLTAVLQWCLTHEEPVWVYGDDSWECPHTRIVQADTGDHKLVAPPWEWSGE